MGSPEAAPHPQGKGSWYRITIFECPICGKTEEFRERQWTPRPDDPRERYEWVQTSGCGSHFL